MPTDATVLLLHLNLIKKNHLVGTFYCDILYGICLFPQGLTFWATLYIGNTERIR